MLDLEQTYPLRPSVYGSSKATGLTTKMEFEIETEQMLKCITGNVTDCLLPDIREYSIT